MRISDTNITETYPIYAVVINRQWGSKYERWQQLGVNP